MSTHVWTWKINNYWCMPALTWQTACTQFLLSRGCNCKSNCTLKLNIYRGLLFTKTTGLQASPNTKMLSKSSCFFSFESKLQACMGSLLVFKIQTGPVGVILWLIHLGPATECAFLHSKSKYIYVLNKPPKYEMDLGLQPPTPFSPTIHPLTHLQRLF